MAIRYRIAIKKAARTEKGKDSYRDTFGYVIFPEKGDSFEHPFVALEDNVADPLVIVGRLRKSLYNDDGTLTLHLFKEEAKPKTEAPPKTKAESPVADGEMPF